MHSFPIRRDGSLFLIGRDPASSTDRSPRSDAPDWVQADPHRIQAQLRRALAQPSGGWAVLDATRTIRARGPLHYLVAGHELVAWMAPDGTPCVGPAACPHMGASLACGRIDAAGRVVCPWHGLALGDRRHGTWAPLPAHDDGVLTWVRLDALLAPGERPTEAPILSPRPPRYLDAVVRMEAACEPEDVIANRLDPWHGVHFHPHSFARLRVIDEDDTSITVRVVYRIAGRLGIEVDARFHCPDPRTITMTIIAGEGVGSVVETHATPLGPGRTAIIEAVLAYSERKHWQWLPRAGPLLRDVVRARAARLWHDDARYCERTYELRRHRLGLQKEPVAGELGASVNPAPRTPPGPEA
jgi:isorenieratene synthase